MTEPGCGCLPGLVLVLMGALSFLAGGVAGPLILAFWLALLLGVLIVLGLASFALLFHACPGRRLGATKVPENTRGPAGTELLPH